MNRLSLCLRYSLLATILAATATFAASPKDHPDATNPIQQVSSKSAMPKPGTGNFVQRFIRDLRSSGLEVSVGYPTLYTQADCDYSYPVFHNCFGNNPASPYVMPVVKSWPDEYVDPAMVNGMGRTRPGYSATYRLDPREAIILFGRMPPPGRYMGLETWIFTTGPVSGGTPWNEEAYACYAPLAGEMIDYFFNTVPPADEMDEFIPDAPDNPDRLQSFSSITNNINNVVMQNLSGRSPWNEMRYFVITPDQRTDAAVRQALAALGVDDMDIFTEAIPETFQGQVDPDLPPCPYYGQNPVVGPLGLGEGAVDFTTAVRYAMPEDEQAAHVWRKSLPLTVLRVRRPSWSVDPEPYGDQVADDRYTVDESYLGDDLKALTLSVVAHALRQGWRLEADRDMIDILNELGQFGPRCREIGMNCLGDGQDASYYFAKPQSLDTGRIYAVVGTLGTETGNGTYVGLSVNDASLLKGVLNIDDSKLKGSASSYASDVPNADKFFVHFFSRDCASIEGLTNGACTAITTDMIPLFGDDRAPGNKDLHGMFSIALRTYVVRGYERGPDPEIQLTPHTLTFMYE